MSKMQREVINYKIINQSNEDAEIRFYGVVVEDTPRNWFTGEKEDGMYSSLEEFLNDVKSLETKKNILIRINSCGGDFNAGVTIHNRLKDLQAHKVGIIDGLCASAATLIACACDELKVFPSSRFMVHSAKIGLCGYFSNDGLEKAMKQLKTCETSMIPIYKNKTNKTEEELISIVNAETWFVGQEIIDNGFADILIDENESEDIKMQIVNGGEYLIANGIKHNISQFKNCPIDNISEQTFINKIKDSIIETLKNAKNDSTISLKNQKENKLDYINSEERNDVMCKNLEELKNAYPDLLNEFKSEVLRNERERIQKIEEIQNTISDVDLVNKAKFDEKECMTAEELAFSAMKTEKEKGSKYLNSVLNDNKDSNVAKVETVANSGATVNQKESEVKEFCEIFKETAEQKNSCK